MAQFFSQRAVLPIKLALVVLPLLAVGAFAIYQWRDSLSSALGDPVGQPISFSHKRHVGEDGIDCRYCHTLVEKSRLAGLPSTEICLTCHARLITDAPFLEQLKASQASGQSIPWRRVNDLPDFVNFDHGVHVQKGVSCGECHGAVERMSHIWREASLEMSWCMDCHRAPEYRLHPPAEVFTGMRTSSLSVRERQDLKKTLDIKSASQLTDCKTCHP